MDLKSLKPAKGSRKVSKRLGRGESSGKGKTSGKGHKGQKARSGGRTRPGFEGGQMPLYRRIPKFGFYSKKQIEGVNQYNVVNLDQLNRFDADATVDLAALNEVGLADKTRNKAGIKILGRGELTKKINLKVQACSETAKQAIEKLGGTVEIVK